eukprot:TRINITY_DN13185_c0_g1_i1.p1 TRINITY_DN13185_c0_g1~~TRINITY_DN13185_c0_g1_i1.p1  ORF type:complete len:142 (-),score=15.87 TRINITY_DN13185_c0_g1_i1:139-564(-)
MALSKDPSLFARSLSTRRMILKNTRLPVSTGSFLWPAWHGGDIEPFQFDELSPDDLALALRNKAINAEHHTASASKPKSNSGTSAEGRKTFKAFTKTAAPAAAEDQMRSLEGSITGMKIDRKSNRPKPKATQGRASRTPRK